MRKERNPRCARFFAGGMARSSRHGRNVRTSRYRDIEAAAIIGNYTRAIGEILENSLRIIKRLNYSTLDRLFVPPGCGVARTCGLFFTFPCRDRSFRKWKCVGLRFSRFDLRFINTFPKALKCIHKYSNLAIKKYEYTISIKYTIISKVCTYKASVSADIPIVVEHFRFPRC